MKNISKVLFSKHTLSMVVALIVFFPILSKDGFVNSYDLVWGPNILLPPNNYNSWSTWYALSFFDRFLDSTIIQKSTLLTICLISIYGARALLRTLLIKRQWGSLEYMLALLYVFNPFFYTRLMAGQWLVLLGYALLPWAVRAIYLFVTKPGFKTAWPVALWTGAIGLSSIHTIYIVAVAGIGLLLYSGRKHLKQKALWGVAIVSAWVLINSLWLVPFVMGDSQSAQNVSTFSRSQQEAFATNGTVLGSVPLSAALLTGFWADDTNRYILPSSLPIWWIGVALVATLVIAGVVTSFRRKDRLGYTFAGLGVVAWLLAMGVAWPPSDLLTRGLEHIVPYFAGYREPHKWLMLLALSYVYFAAIGADRIQAYLAHRFPRPQVRYGYLATLAITPFLFAPTLAWGAAGQLKSSQYPQGWYQAKDYLNNHDNPQDPKRTRIVVFPWHVYMPISFAGRVVANPSSYFFDQTMVTSDDFEMEGVPPQGATPTTTYISSEVMPNTDTIRTAGQTLSDTYDVQYILLLKESDWQKYVWLNYQKDTTKVLENDSLILYKIKTGKK
jgi:hypothetical protein